MLVAGCRSNYGSGWFKVFTWFFLWETRPACRGSHMQLELLIEAFTLWEGCCLVFSKKKRGDGWVALVWVLIHSVLFSCHDFVLNTLVFFFSGNFLLQRAKKPLSFHLCFFHNDIEWSGEENVKPSRFCEYTQFTIRKWSKSWVLCFQPNSSNALKRYMFMSGDDDATPTSDNITTLNSACGAELVKFCCKIVGWQDQHWTVTDSWCWWVGNIAATAEKDGPVVLLQY